MNDWIYLYLKLQNCGKASCFINLYSLSQKNAAPGEEAGDQTGERCAGILALNILYLQQKDKRRVFL